MDIQGSLSGKNIVKGQQIILGTCAEKGRDEHQWRDEPLEQLPCEVLQQSLWVTPSANNDHSHGVGWITLYNLHNTPKC